MTMQLKTLEDRTLGVIEGAVMWAKVYVPTPDIFNAGKTKYSIDVEADDEDLKALKKLGATKKTFKTNKGELVLGPTGKKILSISCSGTFADGNKAPGPGVLDTKGNKLIEPIGNGSTALVSFEIRQSKGSKFGPSMRLTGVKVLTLNEFTGETDQRRESTIAAQAELLGVTSEQLTTAASQPTVDDALENTSSHSLFSS